MHQLEAISPIDGRYHRYAEPLANFFSERALMRYRLIVEGEYLIALSESHGLDLRKLKVAEKKQIRSLYILSPTDAQIISDIETNGYKNIKATEHDVKAVEYYMKDKLATTSLDDVLEWIHFGLTSYDTNTPARGMMLRDALERVIIPKLEQVYDTLNALATKHKDLPMLARTHGQPASPTTFGKEIQVFGQRLNRQLSCLKKQTISVKFSGATGNFNAHVVAYPKVDWIKFAGKFIDQLNSIVPELVEGRPSINSGNKTLIKLELNLPTTQIDPHDSEAEIFDNLRRINTILLGLNQDIWRYISDEWIIQKAVEGEIGSSAMPHKINPIKFENSEGNLGMANAILNFLAAKLPISRLQRDLSDSTVERNFGVALGYCLIAYDYLLNGLGRITVNENRIAEVLNSHPEVLAEAMQTILRREGETMPYEELKVLTRGKTITMQEITTFIDGLDVRGEVKQELKKITLQNYIGEAIKLATWKN